MIVQVVLTLIIDATSTPLYTLAGEYILLNLWERCFSCNGKWEIGLIIILTMHNYLGACMQVVILVVKLKYRPGEIKLHA